METERSSVPDESLITAHVRHMRRLNRRPRTITARVDLLRRFARATGLPLLEATRDSIELYLDTTKMVATRRVYLAHLRAFYRWAVEEDLLDRDPTLRIVAPKMPKSTPRPISEPDLALALATAQPLVRAWMMLAAFAGLRACEIGPVRGEHIVRSAATPYLLIPEGKGGRSDTVPICPELMAELDQWPTTGWLWKDDGPFHHDVVSRHVGKHLRKIGVRAGLHALRHRFGTQVYALSHGDLMQTKELMRHQSPATSAIYIALDPRTTYEIVGRLTVPKVALSVA